MNDSQSQYANLGVSAAVAICTLLLTGACAAQATADDASNPPPVATSAWANLEYVVGAGVANKSLYLGSDQYVNEFRPLWWLRYGRFTFVGPRGGLARDPDRASEAQVGASAVVLERENVRLNLGLRVENGRSASDAPLLVGIPDIKRRVVYVAGATYSFTPDWSLSARALSGINHRDAGSTATLSLGARGHFAPQTTWNAALSTTYADRHHMQAHFGVPENLRLPRFIPNAGPLDMSAAFSVRHQVFANWSIFGAATLTHLLGDARTSPLTLAPNQRNIFVGVAYQSHGATMPHVP